MDYPYEAHPFLTDAGDELRAMERWPCPTLWQRIRPFVVPVWLCVRATARVAYGRALCALGWHKYGGLGKHEVCRRARRWQIRRENLWSYPNGAKPPITGVRVPRCNRPRHPK